MLFGRRIGYCFVNFFQPLKFKTNCFFSFPNCLIFTTKSLSSISKVPISRLALSLTETILDKAFRIRCCTTQSEIKLSKKISINRVKESKFKERFNWRGLYTSRNSFSKRFNKCCALCNVHVNIKLTRD